MRVGYTSSRSVHVSGFVSLSLLTPQRRLYPLPVRRASALPPASFRLPVARETLAVQLTFPRVGYVEDFHLQVSAPCRAHQKKAPQAGPSSAQSCSPIGRAQAATASNCQFLGRMTVSMA